MEEEQKSYLLWYDNGTGHFDCASRHETLVEAIATSRTGWRTHHRVTDEATGEIVYDDEFPTIVN